MNIHEHQAKELFAKYNIPVSVGGVLTDVSEVSSVISNLPKGQYVVKAQIHAGGRGKAGGVKLVNSEEEAKEVTAQMLGATLITPQTGEEGKVVNRVYIEFASDINEEYYLSAILDRENKCVTYIASLEGGVDIEEVAEKTPEKVIKCHVDLSVGFYPYHGRKISNGLGFSGAKAKQLMGILSNMYKLLVEKDAMQIEINPLIETTEGNLLALDAKMNFDSNALYRHPDIAELRDETEEDPLEVEASEHDLNYIKMSGDIGCMVNGAGLAMATMDIIKLYGADPANFLDVGGGATKEKVREALKIILSDTSVKGVLINIFGGIMRCDIIAEGVVEAIKEIGIKVPIVVRLEGTNVDLGKKIISESGLKVEAANDLDEAAKKIVALIK